MEACPNTATETLKWPELQMVGKEVVHIANSTKGHPLDRTRANGASQVGQDGKTASALRAQEACAGRCPHHGGGQRQKRLRGLHRARPQTISCGPGYARPSVFQCFLRSRDRYQKTTTLLIYPERCAKDCTIALFIALLSPIS